MNLNIALMGFGNVGRALASLLLEKHSVLIQEFGLVVRVVGISTGSHGHAVDQSGIDLQTALDAAKHGMTVEGLHRGAPIADSARFAADCPADLVFESIPTNPQDGQPALDLIRVLLERGVHVVTANKGPVAFGFRTLNALAVEKGVGFLFESTVMDGAPVLGVGREGLPGAEIKRIRGIFNSTTNYILTRMEHDNLDFDAAVRAAQAIGIAETDASLDVDGWDAAIKTVILANVLMGADLRPGDVDRQGIRDITAADIKSARKAGQRIKLVCEAVRGPDDAVSARVAPQRLALDDSLASVMGTSSIVEFETDVLPGLTIIENDPGPRTTAYGMLADMVNIARGRHLRTDDGDKPAVAET